MAFWASILLSPCPISTDGQCICWTIGAWWRSWCRISRHRLRRPGGRHRQLEHLKRRFARITGSDQHPNVAQERIRRRQRELIADRLHRDLAWRRVIEEALDVSVIVFVQRRL